MQTQLIEVEFRIHYKCFYGQTVYVSGSANELGAWRVHDARDLQWNDGDIWILRLQFEIPFDVETSTPSRPYGQAYLQFEYKYFIRDGVFPNWETLPCNRHISVLLQDLPIENSKKILKISDVFSQSCSFHVPTIVPENLGNEFFPVTFIVSLGSQSSSFCNHQLCIVGAFQEWNLSNADAMSVVRPLYGNSRYVGYKTIFLQQDQFPFEYKYVLKSKNNMGVMWEGYGNRVIRKFEEGIYVQDDGYFRVPNSEGIVDCWLDTGYLGLVNTFASCSINSVIQVLFHIKAFREAILQKEEPSNISVLLKRLFEKLLGDSNCPGTKQIVQVLGLSEDVHEFMRLLCHYIENEYGESNNPVRDLFQGKMLYTISCYDVPIESKRTEAFYDISLDIQHANSLEEAIRQYLYPVQLIGESQYSTEVYGKQDAVQTLQFANLPPIMFFHLQRFLYDMNTDSLRKNCKYVKFPTSIDMSLYAPNNGVYDLFGYVSGKSQKLTVSVLVHAGDNSGFSGHYFVYLNIRGKWLKFNDEQVKYVNSREAVEGTFGGHSSMVHAGKRSLEAVE